MTLMAASGWGVSPYTRSAYGADAQERSVRMLDVLLMRQRQRARHRHQPHRDHRAAQRHATRRNQTAVCAIAEAGQGRQYLLSTAQT
jgi:hypothetical protein